jgi:hypothetical protein
MTKHIKKLEKLNERICECEKELENIKTLPYYTLFKQHAQQAEDQKALLIKLAGLQLQKQEALVELQEKVTVTVFSYPGHMSEHSPLRRGG